MKVLVFGASGMVGQGVLRECLLDPGVTEVLVVGRRPLGPRKGGPGHEKLKELVHEDLADWSGAEDRLAGHDACFFCLGVSAAGLSEAEYTRITRDYTLAAAKVLAARAPKSTFIYVSGQGTDPKGRSMWARVKGKVEEELLALSLEAYMFRPGLIKPMHGARSRTTLYRISYLALWPFMPLIRAAGGATTTEHVGKAMLEVARHGASKRFLTNKEIEALAKKATPAL
ncbi:MAG TPA: NAD-dependent epimerase/dehydratase family protein [Kofleriaceae bacterium]|nr:NAD-dependent epimerase/dehydratase family protein [Kofleriaceae bacterium]